MENISLEKLNEFYEETLSYVGLFVLDENDDEIDALIFEDFDCSVWTFLDIETLRPLYENNFISYEKMQESQKLKELYISIHNSAERDISQIKRSPKWLELFLLADKIKSMK